MDTKHPNLVHVSEKSLPAWVSPAHAGRLRQVQRDVAARCGVETYIDIPRREVVWGYHNGGEVDCVYTWPVFRHYHGFTFNKFEASTGFDISVDDICYVIQLARTDPARKRVWEQHRRTMMESERRNRMGNLIHDAVQNASKEQDRKRRQPVTA